MKKEDKRGISNSPLDISRLNLSRANRSQVTIFIIIAILIVAVVLVFFLWIKPSFIDSASGRLEFGECVEQVVEDSIEDLGKRGGYVNPEFHYMYQSEKLAYLCYTNLYYQPCIVQRPFLKQDFESELKKVSGGEIVECYKDSINDLKAQGYSIVAGEPDLKLMLEPGRVLVQIDAPVSISSGDSSTKSASFKIPVNSPMYDLAAIGTSIVQSETRYGDTDVSGLMLFYPNLLIQKIKRGDETKVFIIEDKQSGIKLQFATRSYAWPAGYGTDTGLTIQQ